MCGRCLSRSLRNTLRSIKENRGEVCTFATWRTTMNCEAQSSLRDNAVSGLKKVCPHCGSEKVKKNGSRQTKERGKQQRYLCVKCKYSWTPNNGFWKMKKSDAVVGQAIETYLEGLSLRKTSRNLSKFMSSKMSHQSVLDWIHKYSLMARKYAKTLRPELSNHFYADETAIPIKGKHDFYSVVMDARTRYVIATKYLEGSITAKGNTELWKEANKIKRPKRFQTDSHPTYDEVFNKVFYTRYAKDQVEWIKTNASKTGWFNYRIERLFNTLKDRVRVMRGFKASWSAKLILDAFMIHYNFIRPHQGLENCSPAQKCDVLGFKSWTELLNRSSS